MITGTPELFQISVRLMLALLFCLAARCARLLDMPELELEPQRDIEDKLEVVGLVVMEGTDGTVALSEAHDAARMSSKCREVIVDCELGSGLRRTTPGNGSMWAAPRRWFWICVSDSLGREFCSIFIFSGVACRSGDE